MYFPHLTPVTVAETWCRVWGDGKNCSRTKMTFFREKISFSRQKFLTTFFVVIDQVFQILRFFTVLNVVYNPFFTRKTTISEKNSLITPLFYSVRTFARIRQHNIRPPSPPLVSAPMEIGG